MNLDKLVSWIVGIVIAFAAIGKLDVLQGWIWRTQAKVIHGSRTFTWGSPRFFPASTKTRSHIKQQGSGNGTKQ